MIYDKHNGHIYCITMEATKMAESEPSSSRTNSLNTSSSHNDENHTHVELKGYLWKRTKLSRKWKKQWFLLRNSDLFYGNTPEV